MDDVYRNPGPLQYDGPGAESRTVSLCIEDLDYMGRIKELNVYLDKVLLNFFYMIFYKLEYDIFFNDFYYICKGTKHCETRLFSGYFESCSECHVFCDGYSFCYVISFKWQHLIRVIRMSFSILIFDQLGGWIMRNNRVSVVKCCHFVKSLWVVQRYIDYRVVYLY